eukprot:TRINITY_DN112_c0_g1_i1.p1 TRINITY_DN112_c0_g1~~TRINITY_DN112_c0_g1_i1.p1  ORF type:complete len:343 (+),score=35.89 TRINITY_DN112_c0_g1_i1:31-1059(+)
MFRRCANSLARVGRAPRRARKPWDIKARPEVDFKYFPVPPAVLTDEHVVASAAAAKEKPFIYGAQNAELKLPLFDFHAGSKEGTAEVDPYLFACPPRADILHKVLVWYRASLRAGLTFTKGKMDVQKSRKKLRPQKGTGRARMGSGRSHHLIGGGHCHPLRPKDWSYPLPKKVQHLALRMALSAKLRQRSVIVIRDFSLGEEWDAQRFTDHCFEKFQWPMGRHNVLLVHGTSTELPIDPVDPALDSVVLPLAWLSVTPWNHLNVYDILRYRLVVITETALQNLMHASEYDKNSAAPLHFQQAQPLPILQHIDLPLRTPEELYPQRYLFVDNPLPHKAIRGPH